jgi:Ca2+-binding RTX toxin-like protein
LTGNSDIDGTGNDLSNRITGNTGSNVLTGGLGNDTYVVGTGDSIVEVAGEGTDEVRSSISWTLDNVTENLMLEGVDAILGQGNSGANVMTGNWGQCTLAGGAGDDSYAVTSGGNHLDETGGGGSDYVFTSLTWTLADDFENLRMYAADDISAYGNSASNIIEGNVGNNVIEGRGGADTISGGNGNDDITLTTEGGEVDLGSGTDTLSLETASSVAAVDLLFKTGCGSDTVDFSAISSHTANQALLNITMNSGLTSSDVEFVLHNSNVALHIVNTTDYVDLTGDATHSYDWITVDFSTGADWSTSDVQTRIDALI